MHREIVRPPATYDDLLAVPDHRVAEIIDGELIVSPRPASPVYPNVAYFELVPDWVCEVASPSTMRLDRVKKLHVYAREGVGHVWLVDPLAQTLECYRLENGGWFVAGTFGGNDKVRVEPFEALEIDLERWWPPLA